MWRFCDSDYNLFELHWYHVSTLPSFIAFSFCFFTYCISKIEGFQPKCCRDILGNARFSSKHILHLCFACNAMLAGNVRF